MLQLGSTSFIVDGVQVFHDHADSNTFWYLPAPVSMGTRPDGSPAFTLMVFKPAPDSDVEKGGGFLTFESMVTLDDEHKAAVLSQCRARATDPSRDVALSPVPYDSGTVECIALNVQGPGGTVANPAPTGTFNAVEKILGAGVPEMFGENRAAFSLMLDQEGATIVRDALGKGGAPVGVIYKLQFTALRPALHVKITADLKRVYQELGASLSAQVYFVRAGIEAVLQDLQQKGALKIEVTSFTTDSAEQEKWAMQFFTDHLLKEWFEPTLGIKDIPNAPSLDPTGQKPAGQGGITIGTTSTTTNGQAGTPTKTLPGQPTNGKPAPGQPVNGGGVAKPLPGQPVGVPAKPLPGQPAGVGAKSLPGQPAGAAGVAAKPLPGQPAGGAKPLPGQPAGAGTPVTAGGVQPGGAQPGGAQPGGAVPTGGAVPVGGAQPTGAGQQTPVKTGGGTVPAQGTKNSGTTVQLPGVGAAKGATGDSAVVSFKLKFVHQEEQKTLEFIYDRTDAVQRTYAPQGFFGDMGEALKDSSHLIEIDLDDPFFRKLPLVAQSMVTDFGAIGLQSMDLHLEYGRDTDDGGPKSQDFVFMADSETTLSWEPLLNSHLDTDYRYRLEYHFDPNAGWQGADVSYEFEGTSEDRRIELTPYHHLGFLDVTVQTGDLDPQIIRSTDVTLSYEDANGWARTDVVQIVPDAVPQHWRVRTPSKEGASYRCSFRHTLVDGSVRTDEPEPQPRSASSVVVNDPFADHLEIDLVPAWQGAVRSVFVDVDYDDKQGYHWHRRVELDGMAVDPQHIRIGLVDPEVRDFIWRATFIGVDGIATERGASSTSDTLLRLSPI